MAYIFSGGEWKQDLDTNDEHSWFETLDGDWRKVHLADASKDDGTLVVQGLKNCGRALLPDNMPTKIVRKGAGIKIKPVLDVDLFFGGPLVSEKVKEIVERFEPGVHQLFPMELFIGKECFGTFYFLNICNRLDTMDRNLTFPINERGFFKGKKGKDFRRVLSSEKIGDHHMWRDKFMTDTLCISDPLGQAFLESNLSGAVLKHIEQS